MILIEKIERALVLAKELGLNDNQTKELMALILELPYFKLNLNPPTPIVPWVPNTPTWPGIGTTPYPGDTIITYGVAPAIGGSLRDFVEGRCTSVDLPVHPPITGTFQLRGCACSPIGQPHDDNCKATGINEGRPL